MKENYIKTRYEHKRKTFKKKKKTREGMKYSEANEKVKQNMIVKGKRKKQQRDKWINKYKKSR